MPHRLELGVGPCSSRHARGVRTIGGSCRRLSRGGRMAARSGRPRRRDAFRCWPFLAYFAGYPTAGRQGTLDNPADEPGGGCADGFALDCTKTSGWGMLPQYRCSSVSPNESSQHPSSCRRGYGVGFRSACRSWGTCCKGRWSSTHRTGPLAGGCRASLLVSSHCTRIHGGFDPAGRRGTGAFSPHRCCLWL